MDISKTVNTQDIKKTNGSRKCCLQKAALNPASYTSIASRAVREAMNVRFLCCNVCNIIFL